MDPAVASGIVIGTITLGHMITLTFLWLATRKIRQLQAEIEQLQKAPRRSGQASHANDANHVGVQAEQADPTK